MISISVYKAFSLLRVICDDRFPEELLCVLGVFLKFFIHSERGALCLYYLAKPFSPSKSGTLTPKWDKYIYGGLGQKI